MFSLMHKDYMVLKKTKALYMILGASIFGGIMFNSIKYYFLFSMVMSVYFFIVYTGAYDHKYNSEKIFNSFPINRQSIVIGRYLSAGLCLLVSITIAAITTFLYTLITGSGNILALPQIGVTIILTGVYLSIYFPISYKVGYMNARWANIAGLIFMFSFSSIISNNNEEVQSIFSKYLGVFINSISGKAGTSEGVIVTLIAIFMLIASALMSLKIYRKKEFN